MNETRFTQRAQAALRLAQESAAELGHGYVGSEHLLLGLAKEGRGVASKVLQAAGLEPEGLKQTVSQLVGVGTPGTAPSQGLTPRCKKIIELSLTEAVRLGHQYVGTEHLLLGILREGDGVAVRVLDAAGVEPRRLRADVSAAMGGETQPPPFRGSGKPRTERDYPGESKLLEQFARDLTRMAAGGQQVPRCNFPHQFTVRHHALQLTELPCDRRVQRSLQINAFCVFIAVGGKLRCIQRAQPRGLFFIGLSIPAVFFPTAIRVVFHLIPKGIFHRLFYRHSDSIGLKIWAIILVKIFSCRPNICYTVTPQSDASRRKHAAAQYVPQLSAVFQIKVIQHGVATHKILHINVLLSAALPVP